MLFTRYNLFKNHGDFVHLNMLKWAMKHVPELGKSTVPDDETVNLIEIGTGGIDINTHKDGTDEEKSKHVPYTDVQVNETSCPTFNLTTYGNLEARWDTLNGVFFDHYTKVISPDDVGKTDFLPSAGISFYDKDTINVDGINHNYITKLKYYNKEDSGALTDTNQDKEFKPYTSVIRDDNSLASQMKIKHDEGNHLTGVSFPATGEEYDIPVSSTASAFMLAVMGSMQAGFDGQEGFDYVEVGLDQNLEDTTLNGYGLSGTVATKQQKITEIRIGKPGRGVSIDISSLNLYAKYLPEIIPG